MKTCLEEEIAILKANLAAALRQRDAAREVLIDFIRKCDNGLARSKDTYAKAKAALCR